MVIVRGQIAYHRRLRLTMLATLLLGCAACGENSGTAGAPAPAGGFRPAPPSPDAPPPVGESSHAPDALPALPPGTFVAPLTLQLAGARNALERIVPRRFGNI